MDSLSYFLIGGALALAFIAWRTAKGMRRVFEDELADVKRTTRNTATEVQNALMVQRRLLAAVAEGCEVSREMILDGQLWRDVDNRVGKELLEGQPAALVIDVRTPQETALGTLPGAVLIPVDDLPERMHEIPRDAGKLLLYCAAGSRSAAACEFLASEGYDGLHNLEGGYSSWDGPTTKS